VRTQTPLRKLTMRARTSWWAVTAPSPIPLGWRSAASDVSGRLRLNSRPARRVMAGRGLPSRQPPIPVVRSLPRRALPVRKVGVRSKAELRDLPENLRPARTALATVMWTSRVNGRRSPKRTQPKPTSDDEMFASAAGFRSTHPEGGRTGWTPTAPDRTRSSSSSRDVTARSARRTATVRTLGDRRADSSKEL
jgi:hypothetical protein